jgi:HJR/Mrr/RecB family endonuclease
MDTKQQARALMIRHHKMIKNRQQSMLERAASEIGMDVTNTEYWNNLKKEPLSAGVIMYDRSRASLS